MRIFAINRRNPERSNHRSRHLPAYLAVLWLAAFSSFPAAVLARQFAPEATPAAGVASADPRCDAPQASATGLVSLLRVPVTEDPEAENPQGDPLPPAERSTVDDLVARWSACLAAGNVRGLLGLFTTDGVRRLFSERSPYVGGPAGLRVSILGIGNVERLRDGRIAARVTVDPSGEGIAAPASLVALLEHGEDGVWRIDHLRSPEGPVGAAGQAERDPMAGSRPLLRRPVAPGRDLPIPPPGPTVPMRGGDAARSGNQPGPAPDAAPDSVWRSPTGWHSNAQPVTARGLIFFGGFSLGERTPLLEAVDAATGGIRWQTTAPVAWAEFPDAPALAGDVLYAPVEAPVAGVLAVVAATGEALWFAPFGFTSVTAPAVDADGVFVAGWGIRNTRGRAKNDSSGAVFALDQRTGRERWRFLAPARFGPVAVGQGTVFVPSDHGLYALDRGTGRKRWQARFSPDSGQPPVVVGSAVAFAGSEITTGRSGVFALDPASGALLWRVDVPTVPGIRAGTAGTPDALYVTWWESPDGQPGRGAPTLRAYDLNSGEEHWVYRAADVDTQWEAGVGTITDPVIVDGRVLFGVTVRGPATSSEEALDGLYAVDAQTGSLIWKAADAMPIGSPPAVLGGTIYAMGGLRPRGDAAGGSLLAFAAD